MKKIILSLAGLLLFAFSYSQKINYQSNFNDALAKAKAQKKLLLVSVYAPKPPDIEKRPAMARAYASGIDSPQIIKLYNKNFVNYTVSLTDSAVVPIRKTYQTGITYPVYLFIDGKGNLVYRETGNSTNPAKYINMSKKALDVLASGKTLSIFEDKYSKGHLTPDFIKEYISLREQLGYYDNAKLADEYVALLDPKAAQDYNEVFFILKAGPYAYGAAYNFCYTNHKLVDSIYAREPTTIRSAMNQRIIVNTTAEAINRKDPNLAQQAANYLEGTWSRTDKRKGAISSKERMLYYYRVVKDTASYYSLASFFYDNYYMNISADSAKNLNRIAKENIKKAIMASHPKDTVKRIIKKGDTVKRFFYAQTYISSGSSVTASTLNNAAYEFYRLGTNNQTYLAKAMLWTKRAIALDPTFNYYDTLAHLLYRLGFYDEAASAQSKAVSIAETKNINKTTLDQLKTELDKIKTRKLS